MNYLIDTHTFLWFISDSSDLSEKAKMLIEDENNSIFLSVASLWKIINKWWLWFFMIHGQVFLIQQEICSKTEPTSLLTS